MTCIVTEQSIGAAAFANYETAERAIFLTFPNDKIVKLCNSYFVGGLYDTRTIVMIHPNVGWPVGDEWKYHEPIRYYRRAIALKK
jgi:hypothetical protein